MATTEEIRALRLRTVQAVQAIYVALPVDERVASAFSELVAIARRERRRPRLQDTWIGATARAHGVPVFTQHGDFDDLAVEVVRV